jgi:hypothetical protein
MTRNWSAKATKWDEEGERGRGGVAVGKMGKQHISGRRTLLTAEVQRKICSYIRAGTFDHVAAESCGIAPRTFYYWMTLGERGRKPYAPFAQEVTIARAEARARAEIEVARTNPLAYLRYGPGRERSGQPGWTESRQVDVAGKNGGPLTMLQVRNALLGDEEG